MNRHVTDAEWTAARATPCGMCGQPYHRYCDHDPEHEWDGVACINSLRAEVERSPNYALLVKADRYRTALEEIADWGGMWIAAGAAQALVDEARAALEAK